TLVDEAVVDPPGLFVVGAARGEKDAGKFGAERSHDVGGTVRRLHRGPPGGGGMEELRGRASPREAQASRCGCRWSSYYARMESGSQGFRGFACLSRSPRVSMPVALSPMTSVCGHPQITPRPVC